MDAVGVACDDAGMGSGDGEQEMLQRARSGDSRAVDELLVQHLPALRAYLRLHLPAEVRRQESCSDLVQSVCREVLTQQPDFDYRGPEAFRGWLYQWARHKLQDRVRYWRAEKRETSRRQNASQAEDIDDLAAVYRQLGSPTGDAIR